METLTSAGRSGAACGAQWISYLRARGACWEQRARSRSHIRDLVRCSCQERILISVSDRKSSFFFFLTPTSAHRRSGRVRSDVGRAVAPGQSGQLPWYWTWPALCSIWSEDREVEICKGKGWFLVSVLSGKVLWSSHIDPIALSQTNIQFNIHCHLNAYLPPTNRCEINTKRSTNFKKISNYLPEVTLTAKDQVLVVTISILYLPGMTSTRMKMQQGQFKSDLLDQQNNNFFTEFSVLSSETESESESESEYMAWSQIISVCCQAT